MERLDGFRSLHVHGLIYKDDFCGFADAVRAELLAYPGWIEMRQDSRDASHILNPMRQNGITTGHITERHRSRLPRCLQFADQLRSNLPELCTTAGLQPSSTELSIEINAMAYGEGAWLAGHTDSGAVRDGHDRLIAWMLYLTDPTDGEWDAAKGGSVRLWDAKGNEAKLSPRFNRFAMFHVHKQSFHEIERINWSTSWNKCRLALSGWIRGAVPMQERQMIVYLKSPSYERLRLENDKRLRGGIALYSLLLQQQAYCGADSVSTSQTLEAYREDYRAHLEAPEGTSFIQRVPGPKGCITVVNEQQEVCYVGPIEAMKDGLSVERVHSFSRP